MSNEKMFFEQCKRGNLPEVTNYMKDNRNNINATDDRNGFTGLMYAAWSDKFNSVYALLEHPDIDINYQDPKYKFSALHLAAVDNNEMSVLFLSMFDTCNVNLRNYEGQTPLMRAARHGMAKSVRVLVSPRCNINDTDDNGNTALHLAAKKENKYCDTSYSHMIPKYDEVLDALLSDKRIATTIKNKDGKTALDIATEVGWKYAITKLSSANRTAVPLPTTIHIRRRRCQVPTRLPSTRAAAIKAREKIATFCK